MSDISKISMERIDNLIDKIDELNTKISNVDITLDNKLEEFQNSINSQISSINSKLNSMKYVVETGSYSNGCYRKWNDGFIEQWGAISSLPATNNHSNQVTNLIITFSKTNYYVNIIGTNSNNQYSQVCGILEKTISSFKWSSSIWWSRDANVTAFNWYACGY